MTITEHKDENITPQEDVCYGLKPKKEANSLNMEQILGALEKLDVETEEEMLPAIGLDLSNLCECEINRYEFQKGVDRGSEILGFITAIKQGGLDSSLALALLLNEATIKHNVEIAKINKETSVAVAEKRGIYVDNNQL